MKRAIYILLGVAIGIWTYLSPGTLVMILCGIITGSIICRNSLNKAEKKFLGWTFCLALFLSIILSSFNFYLAALLKNDSELIGDGAAYSAHGAYIAEILNQADVETNYTDMIELTWCRGAYYGKLPDYADYRIGFPSYLYGFIYTLLGYSPLMIKFLNALVGIIGCFLIYFWMRDVCGEKQARIALVLTLFWPSRFIWAASGLKEALTFFGFSLALFMFFRLQKNFSLFWTCVILFAVFIKYNFIYILSLLIILILLFKRKKIIGLLSSFIFMKLGYILVYGIRIHFIEPLMITLAISLCTFLSKRKLIALTGCFIILALFLFLRVDKNMLKEQYSIKTTQIIMRQKSQAMDYVRSRYDIYPERFRKVHITELRKVSDGLVITPPELFVSYLIGLSYFFLSPFPWSIDSKMLALGYIQSILVYLLLPFIIIGIIIGLRDHWREVFVYILFIFVISSIYALYLGNIGTIFRHRDLVMSFFIAFSGIGIVEVLKGRTV